MGTSPLIGIDPTRHRQLQTAGHPQESIQAVQLREAHGGRQSGPTQYNSCWG